MTFTSAIREYSPSFVEETRSKKPETGSPLPMEAPAVLQNLGIEEEMYEWRVNAQEWIDQRISKASIFARQMHTYQQTGSGATEEAAIFIRSFQARFPESCRDYILERLQGSLLYLVIKSYLFSAWREWVQWISVQMGRWRQLSPEDLDIRVSC